MHTHSYTQDIADKHTHTYIHTCTSTSWIHTHSLSVPACVLFHRFPRHLARVRASRLQLLSQPMVVEVVEVVVAMCVWWVGWGGDPHYYVWHHLCFHQVWISNQTHPLFLPAFPHRRQRPPTTPAPPPPPPFSQIWSLSTPLLCPTPPASFPSLPLAPPSPPPSPFFPSVCLSPFLFRCTKCFKFIICILWCMGTIMFFIMEKWERFIFVTGLFHNSFFKLVL